MTKFLFWVVTLIGLVPSILLIMGAVWCLRAINQHPAVRRYSTTYIHDTYASITLWPGSVSLFPRVWVLALIGVGLVSFITGMIFLLHVPFRAS